VQPSILPWLVPAFPLLGFLFNAFLGARLTKSPRPVVDGAAATHSPAPDAGPSDAQAFDNAPASDGHGSHNVPLDKGGMALVGGLATLVMALAFAAALALFLTIVGMHGETRQVFSTRFDWMQTPGTSGFPALNIGFGLVVDPLSSLMLLIITGVGFLIHWYSMGYMSHDEGYARYFTYLNLFVFFMLLLVMGSNLAVMFVGWEGVGLASYLLIGFYYDRVAANNAGKKAFIVNRIGDCALLVAMFLIFHFFKTLEFYGPNGILTEAGFAEAMRSGYSDPGVYGIGIAALSLVPFLMFFGAAGKSAQIPLYVWLPDAMEGPTPVSALIHAATMVTGGVYLLARAHALFLPATGVMTIVAVIGLSTAFLAATIGLVQNDIKRVLAYSTVSQLGYMFLACGVGAFGTAMFHVTTHAFFKALLFLGSGSVIHAMGGEQDMRKMGGLGKKIKLTWAVMLIGTLAISGIPIFAGFWSKDEILLNAFAGADRGGLGDWKLWAGGWIVAGMTAFYMVRLMMKTFGGKPRYSEETASQVHESPISMTGPLVILAILSVVGGLINAGPFLGIHAFDDFLGSTVNWRNLKNVPLNTNGIEMPLLAASVGLAVVMCVITAVLYSRKPTGDLLTDAQKARNPLYRELLNKWGVDEIYDSLIVRPGRNLARGLYRVVDNQVIDGVVNGISGGIVGIANGIKGWQSGYVRNYALSMLVGVVLVVIGCLAGMTGLVR
jgi:NADH-quinone oxidoreductase subunit L